MGNLYSMDNIANANGIYYFVSLYDNGVYRIEPDGVTIRKVMKIPFGYSMGCMEYSKTYYYNNKLFVLPWYAKSIAICDLITCEIRFIDILETCSGLPYLCGVQKGELLYLIPCENKDILIINMFSEKIEESIALDFVENNKSTGVIAWGSVSYDESNIYIPQFCDDSIIKFSFRNRTFEYERIINCDGLNGICDTNNGRWYIPRKSNKLYFQDNNGMHVFDDFPAGYVSGETPFYKVISYGDSIMLLPMDANMLIKVNEKGQFFKLYEINCEQNDTMKRYMFFSNVWVINDICYCIESSNSKVYIITNDNELLPIEFIYDGKEDERFIEMDDKIIVENPYHGNSIENYIFSIINNYN